jgi:hypothetical protein
LGPARLNTDYHHSCHVGIGSGADEGAEMQFQIRAKLQAAIRMGQGQRALDIVGHCLAGSVGEVIHRQDDDVIADADTAIIAAVPPECILQSHFYHRFVLTL